MLETGSKGDRRPPPRSTQGQMGQEGAGQHTQDNATRSVWQASSTEKSPQQGPASACTAGSPSCESCPLVPPPNVLIRKRGTPCSGNCGKSPERHTLRRGYAVAPVHSQPLLSRWGKGQAAGLSKAPLQLLGGSALVGEH